MLNQDRYPIIDYICDFRNAKVSSIYNDSATFSQKFYGMNELLTLSGISPSEFIDLYPIFVFDVSNQSERLKESVMNIQIKCTFDDNVSANTQAYAVVISDRFIKLQSDGNKMAVVF